MLETHSITQSGSTPPDRTLDPHTHTKASILTALTQIQASVHDHFAAFSPEIFVQSIADAWSPAQHLEHLIKAAQPVCNALGMPKQSLREQFGFAQAPSQSFQSLQERYIQGLASGAQASGRFLPTPIPANVDAGIYKQDLLREWDAIAVALIGAVSLWEDADLDEYLLPHPILGKLTVREILFFTLYHSARHISEDGD